MHVPPFCTICSREDEQEEALYACTSTCCVDLKLCALHHKRHLAKFPTHEFNKLKTGEPANTICPRHPLQPINVYCKNCECLLCPMCAVSIEHKGHDYNLIDEIAGKERESIPQQVEQLTKKINEWKEQQASLFKEEDLNMEIELIEKKRIELKKEIHNGIEKIKQQLDKRKEQLLTSTEVICDKNSRIVKTILGFKKQTKVEISTFENINQMSNFDLMAKVTKFKQLSIDIENIYDLKESSDLHDIKLLNFQSKHFDEIINIVDNMGIVYHCFSINVRFTNLGTVGPEGPTSIGDHYNENKHLNNKVTLEDGIQCWEIPLDGKYKITAAGASGGSNVNNSSIREGYGCIVSGEFQLKKGTTLKILVGQEGYDDSDAGGGGGGTFIVTEHNCSPLLIAAGGNGCNKKTNGPGGRLYDKNIPITIGKAEVYGGGGGGFEHDGQSNEASGGGQSFKNGGLGGYEDDDAADGGFGGGGAACSDEYGNEYGGGGCGGGGGGYIGGSVVPEDHKNRSNPTAQYGAISFNCGENQDGKEDANKGHGYVIIERLYPSTTHIEPFLAVL